MKNYDITIAYRICPFSAKMTPVFHDNKYKLSELCLHSLKNALGDLNVKMLVLFDNCPDEYVKLFQRYFKKEDLEIHRLDGIGNFGTFNMQIDLLLKQDYSDVVYFAEDDYFYLPGSIKTMFDFLRNGDGVDFVSPYDHLDLYEHPLHNHGNEIRIFGGYHWRTANSTCLTFMTTKKVLIKTKKSFLSFSRGNHDASLWLSMTKFKLNPFKAPFYLFTHKGLLSLIAKAWYYTFFQVLFIRRKKLWIAIPSLSTHMQSEHIAPNVDWYKLFDKEIRELKKSIPVKK